MKILPWKPVCPCEELLDPLALANGLLIPAAESKEAVKLKVDWLLLVPKVMG